MKVHLVYAFGSGIGHPDSVGRELQRRLSGDWDLVCHSLYDRHRIQPADGDILIGSPFRGFRNCFEKSLLSPKWSRRILLVPFCPGMDRFAAFLDECVDHVDRFLAITGKYWFDATASTIYSHWLEKMVHVDLAVRRDHFPVIKTRFSAPGHRKFLYIGHTMAYKNPEYLGALIDANPDLEFGHIGKGHIPAARLLRHGELDFTSEANRRLVAEYDFLVMVGSADANPTTILEAAAWGLVPVCTRESGYYESDWIVNVPFGDVRGASTVLRQLNDVAGEILEARQTAALGALDAHFNWDRFGQQVKNAISDAPATFPRIDKHVADKNRKEIRQHHHYHIADRREDRTARLTRWLRNPHRTLRTMWRVIRAGGRRTVVHVPTEFVKSD